MKTIPHFTFDGEGEEVLHYYAAVFHGEIRGLVRCGEAACMQETGLNEKDKNRIMYSSLAFGEGNTLHICDSNPSEPASTGNGSVMIDIVSADPAETERLYRELSDGGNVTIPLAATSWTGQFASVTDRFGICWNLWQE